MSSFAVRIFASIAIIPAIVSCVKPKSKPDYNNLDLAEKLYYDMTLSEPDSALYSHIKEFTTQNVAEVIEQYMSRHKNSLLHDIANKRNCDCIPLEAKVHYFKVIKDTSIAYAMTQPRRLYQKRAYHF